eukprot:5611184-Alexandrium_andersonii.AAC.1
MNCCCCTLDSNACLALSCRARLSAQARCLGLVSRPLPGPVGHTSFESKLRPLRSVVSVLKELAA